MSASVDVIVAGAGIWGCTVARRQAEAGRRVLVLEKRMAVGGNCRCEIDSETGIEIHVYGSHIFHTHNKGVWDFVRRFTEFNGYQHKVLANYGGKTYQLPLGLSLVNKFFSVELKPEELKEFLTAERRQKIFDAFFRGYTSKQWGMAPEEVDPNIIKRVPVRSNYDTNYFNDYWQGIPSGGYNKLFERLLDHPNIEVCCSQEFQISGSRFQANGVDLPHVPVYYSGPIDALFGYKFGPLPWRSLRFECEKMNVSDYQGTSVINYTAADVPYTRIHEFKHYHPEGNLLARGLVSAGRDWGWKSSKTIIMHEYPKAWHPGDEPYYPINTSESGRLLRKYQEELAQCNQTIKQTNDRTVVVGGRLGGYKYYDMDQAMASALEVAI